MSGSPDADWRQCVRDAAAATAMGFGDLGRTALRRALPQAPADIAAALRVTLGG